MNPRDQVANVEFVVLWTVIGLAVGVFAAPVVRSHLTERLPQPRLPVVTATMTSALFALTAITYGLNGTAIACGFLAAVSTPIAVVDVLEHRIPTRLVYAAYPGMISTLTVVSLYTRDFGGLGRAAISAGCLISFYLLVAVAAQGALGAGDVRLAGPCGLVLGWESWSAVTHATLMAFCFGALVVLARRMRIRVDRDESVAFGPAMLAGTFTALVLPI